MKMYCETCKVKNCDLRDQINFCEDCADYLTCDIKGGICGTCEADYDIECNNGFELGEDYYPYPEYDDFALFFGELDDDEEEI